jgi:predicted RNA binding protein YcfA (HicA-like mRNA interferase family)
MPKKIRELKAMLQSAGWIQIPGAGKGSHTKWQHPSVPRRLTLSGKDGNDADHYQEKDVRIAIREATGGRGGAK